MPQTLRGLLDDLAGLLVARNGISLQPPWQQRAQGKGDASSRRESHENPGPQRAVETGGRLNPWKRRWMMAQAIPESHEKTFNVWKRSEVIRLAKSSGLSGFRI